MDSYDPARGCVKCGGTETRDRYCTGEYPSPCWYRWIAGAKFPHLHRECKRCLFEWAEAPLDAVTR